MLTQNLAGRHVVVVGGSSGIGRAVAALAHEAGARVTLTSLSADKAQVVAAELGPTVVGAVLDVNDEARVNRFFATLGPLDHVYVAAGSTKLGSVLAEPLDDSLRAFDERLRGSLRVVRAAVGQVNPAGSFTFTGGVSTDQPIAGAWVSGLGTAAAEQLARVLVMEFPGVRFNAVAPGYTDTPMWDTVLGENKVAMLSGIASKLPVGKVATAEEVAAAVVFMMANHSITGEVLHVDGGARLV